MGTPLRDRRYPHNTLLAQVDDSQAGFASLCLSLASHVVNATITLTGVDLQHTVPRYRRTIVQESIV